MNPRNVLWPASAKADPNGIQRLARVLQWCFAAGAAACVLGAILNSDSYTGYAIGAVSLAMFGRAVRYVMAGE
jgi:hypothetical protein